MRYTDGDTEVLTAGQAYYIRPGHNAHIDDDASFGESSRADQTPGINPSRSSRHDRDPAA